MRFAPKFFLVLATLFLSVGVVLTGSLGYAQLNGLSLTGDTYTVNFDSGNGFSPSSITINRGDLVYVDWPLESYTISYPETATVEISWSLDGHYFGSTEISDAITFTPKTNQYGLTVNGLVQFDIAGKHTLSLYVVWVGQEGTPYYSGTFSCEVTVNAPAVKKSLSLAVSGEGSLYAGPSSTTWEVTIYAGDSSTKVYERDQYSLVYLEARPTVGWRFLYWLMNDGSQRTSQDIGVVLDDDMSALAVFGQQAVLTVSTDGLGYVTVSPPIDPGASNVDTVSAGQSKLFQHDFGTQITLYAWPLSNCAFDHWILPDGSTSTSNPVSFTLSSDSSVQAVFRYGSSSTPNPTVSPTDQPYPTLEPTVAPTVAPTVEPTPIPTVTPQPTLYPTPSPTPTLQPTTSVNPSASPSPTPSTINFFIPKTYRTLAWISGFASLGLSGVCFTFFKLTLPRRRS